MAGDRYVVLGLARPRAVWFRDVATWATSASIPAEFLKCVSFEEVRVRLTGPRVHSALLVDGGLPALDRDLVAAARDAGCVVLVVDDDRARRDWLSLGAVAVLPSTFSREVLLDTLATHAAMVGRIDTGALGAVDDVDVGFPVGAVAAVCGPGGTGASTVAIALAQGLAAIAEHGDVVLADLALHAEQAMLHDVRDVVPGIQELVEAHRSRRPTDDELDALLFHIVARRYHLLLGLRRARFWSTLRPRAIDAAFESLRRRFGVVVCDLTADVEGEDEGGSVDVGERNHLARTAVRSADVVFVVGRPGAKGLHALVRVLVDLGSVGVPGDRVVPVITMAPRHPRARAEISDALAALAVPAMGGGRTATPVFLPTRRVEDAIRDGRPIPAPLPSLVAGAFAAAFRRLGPAPTGAVEPEPELVTPGSLGMWLDDEDVS